MRVSHGAGTGPVAQRIRLRRGGPLRPLDSALLHAPALADAWNTFIGALRSSDTIDARLRELIVLRIAFLNDASYEWAAHEPVAVGAGVSAAELSALRSPADAGAWVSFDDREQRVLRFAEASTRGVTVSEAVFEDVVAALGERGVVEVALLVAAYNMVSRFLVALGLTADDLVAATS